MWEWSFFDDFDDETLVPVNLTYREMALISSAISSMDNFDFWDTEEDYFNEVIPLIGTILEILRQDNG